MSAGTRGGPARTRRRPRDRKAQIVAVAAERFHRLGYHNVGMEEVARAVGITAGALYRHFRGKQELLASTIIGALERAASDVEDADTLDGAISALASSAAERRDIGVLWTRESRHLNDQQHATMRERFFVVPQRLTEALRASRPDLAEPDANMLAWMLLAVLTSPSYHAIPMAPEPLAALLHRMATVVCRTRSVGGPRQATATTRPANGAPGLPPGSRREALLSAATRLFHQHGYHTVSMEDIGAAVGITSASVYNHFTAKSDLLVAALTRAAGTLQLGMSQALAEAGTARDALHGAVRSYVRIALSHPDLIGALVSEVMNLPDAQRHEIRRLQHDYVAEWVRLLMTDRPELGQPDARFVVHGALTVINDASRTRHLRERPGIAAELHDLALELLLRS